MNPNKRRGPSWRRAPMVHSKKNVERMREWGRMEPAKWEDMAGSERGASPGEVVIRPRATDSTAKSEGGRNREK